MKSPHRVVAIVVRANVRHVAKARMTLAYIAIGSNLASPLEQVNAAVQALGEIPKAGSWRFPLSTAHRRWDQDQPDYLNAAVVLETALMPKRCWITQRIELQQGACAKPNAGVRATLDLDIMLFGHQVINRTSDRSALRYEKSRVYALAAV
jgi:2-amino-4-hydroxy-6-hydroxymethyldihydropteridine diphosphokinase